jgi:arsenate reductase
VDLQERAASAGELRRFVQRFGVEALIDRASRRFADLGLGAARLNEERWLEKLVAEPLLLRVPLVRHGNSLTIGDAEESWRGWIAR